MASRVALVMAPLLPRICSTGVGNMGLKTGGSRGEQSIQINAYSCLSVCLISLICMPALSFFFFVCIFNVYVYIWMSLCIFEFPCVYLFLLSILFYLSLSVCISLSLSLSIVFFLSICLSVDYPLAPSCSHNYHYKWRFFFLNFSLLPANCSRFGQSQWWSLSW